MEVAVDAAFFEEPPPPHATRTVAETSAIATQRTGISEVSRRAGESPPSVGP